MRIPPTLLIDSLASKDTRPLLLLLAAKQLGSRVELKLLLDSLGIHPKTGKRYVDELSRLQWAGYDGKYLFPRSWKRIGHSKKYGQSINKKTLTDLRVFEAYAFAIGIKEIFRGLNARARNKEGSATPKGVLSSCNISRMLKVNERKVKRLKAFAKNQRFINVFTRYRIVGMFSDYESLKKNIHGPALFRKGKFTVTPDVSEIEVTI